MSADALYDRIARIYDPWSVSVTEDVEFYVDEAVASGGPVVELAVGTGRIAVPVAKAGVRVIGVDESPEMLAVARAYAEREGVSELVDLRLGDLREPPVEERVPLVTIPFRSLLHMPDEAEKLRALEAAAALLEPGGRLDLRRLRAQRGGHRGDGRDLARARAGHLRARRLGPARADARALRPRRRARRDARAPLALRARVARPVEQAGLVADALFGWFDRRSFEGGEDQIWVCRRPR